MATRYVFYYLPDNTTDKDQAWFKSYGGTSGWFTGEIDESVFVHMAPELFTKFKIQEIPKEVANAVVFHNILPYPDQIENGFRRSVYEGECEHTYDEDGNYVSSYWTAADKTLDFSHEDPKSHAPKLPGKYQLTSEDVANAVEYQKLYKTAYLKERMEKEFHILNNSKTALEKHTWSEQARQADLYANTGDEADAPLIKSLADARGRTFIQQLNKTKEKIAEWNQKVSDILGPYQRRIDYIKSATTIQEVFHYENEWATDANGSTLIAELPSDY